MLLEVWLNGEQVCTSPGGDVVPAVGDHVRLAGAADGPSLPIVRREFVFYARGGRAGRPVCRLHLEHAGVRVHGAEDA